MADRILLGIRSEPDLFHWAIVEGDADTPILTATDQVEAPNTYSEAEALSFFRDKALHIIGQYRVTDVAIRYPEPFARGPARDSGRKRCRVEGVIMEAASSRSLPVLTAILTTISKHLGTKSAKAYLDRDDLRGLDWSKYSTNRREAILVAVAGLSE
jgi:hypothetical protein